MAQGNKGSDLSDLKARLGLNKGQDNQEEAGEASSGPQQNAPGAESQAGGGPQQGAPEDPQGMDPGAATRVGPPPGESFPPADDHQNAPQGGPQIGHDPAPVEPEPLEAEPVDNGRQSGPGANQQQPNYTRPNQSSQSGQPAGMSAPGGASGADSPSAQSPGGLGSGGPGAGGPPPGASSGPPPGVDSGGAPSSSRSKRTDTSFASSASSSASTSTSAEASLSDLNDDDMDEGFGFTPALVGLGVLVLGAGLLFGIVGMSTYQTRKLYQMQTNQAQGVVSQLEPRLDKFEEVKKIVGTLDEDSFEPDKIRKLAENTVAINSSILGSDKLLLGERNTVMLTSYLVNMERLNAAIERHRRLSLEKDIEELKKINEVAEAEGGEKAQFALLFNFDHLKSNGAAEDFQHQTGVLGTVENFDKPNEKGEVTFVARKSGSERKVPVQWVVPIDRGDLLTVGGENALQRYQQRVKELKHRVKKIGSSPSALYDQLNKLAGRGAPPLLNL